MPETAVMIVMTTLCALCFAAYLGLYLLFRQYKTLVEEIILFKVPGFSLPPSRNDMLDKIKEDRVVKEAQQKSQGIFDLLKTGECDENDIKKFDLAYLEKDLG